MFTGMLTCSQSTACSGPTCCSPALALPQIAQTPGFLSVSMAILAGGCSCLTHAQILTKSWHEMESTWTGCSGPQKPWPGQQDLGCRVAAEESTTSRGSVCSHSL